MIFYTCSVIIAVEKKKSMVLGGIDKDGAEVFNLLSEMCLVSSGNLLMIVPKINLRVGKNTPLRVYGLGSKLTKAGLGVPQYSNDDLLIPALMDKGYAEADACNYVDATPYLVDGENDLCVQVEDQPDPIQLRGRQIGVGITPFSCRYYLYLHLNTPKPPFSPDENRDRLLRPAVLTAGRFSIVFRMSDT